MLEHIPRRSRLSFQVDLFPAHGNLPADLGAVGEREKDIRYSSRTRAGTDLLRRQHDIRHNINSLFDKLPDDLKNAPEAQFLYNFGCVTTMDIVQIVYQPPQTPGASKDYEFSRETMLARWDQGRRDAEITLMASPWLAPMPEELGARTFDVLAAHR